MYEQFSWRNNIELAGIPNSIRDDDLEETVINICKEHGIDISPMDIEVCHRLPLSYQRPKTLTNVRELL